MGTGSGVVSNPDTEVLNLQGTLLVDLREFRSVHIRMETTTRITYDVQADNLSVCLLDLAKLRQEIPEAGLCNNIVRSKDAHSVELRRRVSLAGQMAANDLVFRETT